jgi:uncharacterized protein
VGSIAIELSDIREGTSRFSFRVGPEEIDLEDEGSVFRKPVDVALELTRTGSTIRVRGTARTDAERTCGRCLVPYADPVNAPIEEALRVEGDRARILDSAYEGDPGFLPGSPGSIAFDEIVREVILVSSPMQPICRPDCRGLCPVCGADRNRGDCGCRTEGGHPGWDALRDLNQELEKRD